MSARRPGVVLRWVPSDGGGWQPIVHLVALAERFLAAEIRPIASDRGSPLRRLARGVLAPASGGEEVVIYLVFHPRHIKTIVGDSSFGRPAALRVLWIVDSFWTEEVPQRLLRNFDRVVYMQTQDAAFYERVSNGRALCVPWGADVLDLGGAGAARAIDVLRMGRQPPDWEDDDRTSLAAQARGLTFHGRPPMDLPYAQLMEIYRRSRVVVAFSNLAAPARHTHPTKAYFTGRWTDALANGTTVAGLHPLEDRGVADLLWDGALLSLGRIDLEENLAEIERAARAWTPDVARHNHRMAMERLDWRWRLRDLAAWLGLTAPALDAELDRLAGRVESLREA